MANANSKAAQYRNGFEIVTRAGIDDFSGVAMEAADNLRTILATIKRLAPDDQEITGLSAQGHTIADMLHNDIDVIRERAKKAGVHGELVDEAREGGAA